MFTCSAFRCSVLLGSVIRVVPAGTIRPLGGIKEHALLKPIHRPDSRETPQIRGRQVEPAPSEELSRLRDDGPRMDLRSLTVKERILLHLFDYQRFSDAYDVPSEVTQDGIASDVAIRVHHVAQYVKPLIAEGRVEERTAHILKSARQRKAYFLTSAGRGAAAQLRDALLKEDVPFRGTDGRVEHVPLARVYQEERRGTRLLPLLGEIQERGYIVDAAGPPAGDTVDFIREAPIVERFFGRREELDGISAAMDRASAVVITGMAGMGKTTLAAKILEAQRGKRSAFWRQIRPWDSGMDLAVRFAAFLAAIGRRGLHGYLAGPQAKEWSRIEDLMAADVRGLAALAVFDDLQHAAPEAVRFLEILLGAVKRAAGPKVLLLSRAVPSFYDRRDVEAEGAVIEFALKGLDVDSGRKLLEDRGVPARSSGGLARACGGVPLFLKLVPRAREPDAVEVERTLEGFLLEELEPSLDPVERECLEVASLYEIPVPADGLLFEERTRRQTLASLTRKGLLDRVGSESYTAHEFLRTYFRNSLSEDRRAKLATRVVSWLSHRAEAVARRGQPSEAIAFLGNAIQIDVEPVGRRIHLEELGDLRRLTGDTAAAVDAYRSARNLADIPPVQAMLAQKIAGLLLTQGHLEEAEAEIEGGLRVLTPAATSLEADWLFLRRAQLAHHRRDHRRALEHLLPMASWKPGPTVEPALRAEVANLRGLIHMESSEHRDLVLARAEFQEAAEAFEAARDLRGLCRAYNNLGWVAQTTGQRDAAIAYLDKSEVVARSAGDIPGLHTALQTKAWALSEMYGDYERAETLYTAAYHIAKSTQQVEKYKWLLWHFAQLYRRQGRYVEAREALEYFARGAAELLDPESRVLYALNPLVRISVLCGDISAAGRYFEEAQLLAGETPSGTVAHFLAWAHGTLEAAREKPKEALREFLRASELATEASHPGEFCLEYGRFLATIGRHEEAREQLLRADSSLAKLGLEPLRQQAVRALARKESADHVPDHRHGDHNHRDEPRA